MADVPEYVIKPKISRIIISQTLLTAILAFVFYAGIFLNVTLLDISVPANIKWLIVAVLGVLVILQTLLSYVQSSRLQYLIFKNRVQVLGGKNEYIMFNAIQDIQVNQNLVDKLFNTGTITLLPNVQLKAVANFDQTNSYLRQLIQYARNQYNQM
ncbi:MAG TPA: PH domain-containing protein [Candidatus Nanoarchaeia archaeon]|nr:PH domain-containing protein [Candidatus Nanoarchaeia archaeon]